jgi:hypothetical protein
MDLVEARLQGFAVASRHPWERARLALVSRLIARHAPVRPGDVVVDVGCGDTFVAESLARRYPDAMFYAVDSAFTPALIEVLSARLTVSNVSLYPSIDDIPSGQAAALVLLMDVLEHVEDDLGLLHHVTRHRCFSGSTRLLITVPSYTALFCAHDRFLGHHRRYTIATLNAVLNSARLLPIEEGHLFASLVPLRLLQLLREKVVGTQAHEVEGLAGWKSGETLGRSLASLLEWDGRMGLALLRLGVPWPGLSNFAVCRRSA